VAVAACSAVRKLAEGDDPGREEVVARLDHSALLGLGKAAIRDLTPDDLVIPPGFTRTLGGDGPIFDPAGSRQATTG
jgi:hypothetical protein